MITPSWYPAEKQLRQFAMICLPAFAMIGYAVFRWTGSMGAAWALAVFGAVCFLVGTVRPSAIRFVYLFLLLITMPIGWLVSHIILRVIYYGILTPLGLLFRLIGRDPLRLKSTQDATFWQEHTDRTDPRSYFRQA